MDASQVIEIKPRLAEMKDLTTVYRLYMEEASNPYLTYDPMSEKDFEEIFEQLLDSNTLYVVELHNKVIATYRLIPKTFRQAHTLYLGSFVVSAAQQGKGIGSKILDHIRQLAANEGKTRIELTVDLNNTAAINLYRKAGFEIEGLIRKSYKTSTSNDYLDEYLMGLIL